MRYTLYDNNILMAEIYNFSDKYRVKNTYISILKEAKEHRIVSHCQKFGSKWRARVRIESLMAAKSCKEMYGISTKIQNTTTKSHNIP